MGRSALPTTQDRMKKPTHLSRARELGVLIDGTVTAEVLAYVRTLPCAYCEAPPPSQAEHVIPVTKQGPHTVWNIIPACGRCNARKGNRLIPLSVELRATVKALADGLGAILSRWRTFLPGRRK